MTRTKKITILFIVLLVLICTLLTVKLVNIHVDKINTTDEIILSFDKDSVSSFEITNGEDNLKLIKDDNGSWKVDGLDAFPVSEKLVSDFLNHFCEVHAVFVVDDVQDYSQYGLENSTTVAVFNVGDEVKEISLGDFSQMDSNRYASVNDGKAYLVEDDLVTYLTCDKDEFMQHDETDEFESFDELVLSGEDSAYIVYDSDGIYTYTDKYNYYEISTGNHLVVDDDLVTSYAETAVNLTLTDYATYEASSEDLAEFGLEEPEKTITVRGKDYDGKDVEMILYLGKTDSGEKDDVGDPVYNHYARYDKSEIIYNISTYSYDKLIAGSYNSLRPDSLLTLDWDNITGVTFELDGSTYVITAGTSEDLDEVEDDDENTETDSDSDEDDGTIYILNGKKIEFDGIESSIDDLCVDDFCSGNKVSEKEISFTVFLDNEYYPELAVTLYRFDGENCVASLNGTQVGLISRSDVISLKEALNSIILSMDK